MTNKIIPYVCPYTGENLVLDKNKYISPSNRTFKIKNHIPRFCQEDNYTESFGLQWNLFNRTQLDSFCDINLSNARLWAQTGWDPKSLDDLNILEVGSGAGRFTEAFLGSTNCNLYSVDYSSAVEANLKNNFKFRSRLYLCQASIYQMPFKDNSFDKCFCFGVLQHTPSFEKSIESLVKKVKVNGELVVDFYPIKGFYTKIHAKYFLRPITKRLPKKTLLFLIKKSVPISIFIFEILKKIKLAFLIRFLPINDVRTFPKSLNKRQKIEWAIMDTFDCYSPEHDNPQKLSDVINMFKKFGCEVNFGGLVKFNGGSSLVVRAKKLVINKA